jgi:hypothetical protein
VTSTLVMPTASVMATSSSRSDSRSRRSRFASGSSSSSRCGLAARQLVGPAGRLAGQPDQLDHLGDPLASRGRGDLAHAQPELDVLRDAAMGEQRVVLEHHPDVARLRRQVVDLLPPERHRAGVRRFEARDDAQDRRLARPGRAEQREPLARPDRQVDAVDRPHLAVVAVQSLQRQRVDHGRQRRTSLSHTSAIWSAFAARTS